ncbi:MAG: SrfA family protein [Rhodospirillaceae bacterium]
MDGESTLIVTTRAGVRPLGIRGEPLHNWAAPLRGAIRRRLGDGTADLLADPQLHEDGKAIDWYAGWTGEVHKVADLEPARRSEILAQVDAALGDIARFGAALSAAGHGEDSGLIGRSLQLAAKKPAESFVFLVGDRPVVVCWGYEKEAAASLMGPALPRVPERRSVLDAPPPPRALPVRPLPMGRLSVRAVPRTIPWFRSLLLALPLLLLLLGGAWLLRELLPADPETAMATHEGPDPAPAVAPPDRLPAIKASLSTEQARAKALRLELAAIEGELKKRVSDCRPPEAKQEPPKPPPKPPEVAKAEPPPAPKPAPPPPPQPQRPSDGRMRMPTAPTRDFSFMAGCWRTDPFKHERMQVQMGVSRYCFDANGYGSLEWRRGRTACRTNAHAVFNGPNLALRDQDTTCNDGSHWYADQLVCRRGADNVADCQGYSQGAFGPTSWLVNLHRIN